MLDHFREQQRVGRGAAEHGGLQIDHHFQLFFRIAGAHGDSHSAEAFYAGLKARAGCPETVAGGDLDAVALGETGYRKAAGKHIGPVVDILLGVGDDDGLAGRAGGGMDAHHLFVGHALHAQGIVFPQLAFGGEGQLFKIGLRTDIAGLNAQLAVFCFI